MHFSAIAHQATAFEVTAVVTRRMSQYPGNPMIQLLDAVAHFGRNLVCDLNSLHRPLEYPGRLRVWFFAVESAVLDLRRLVRVMAPSWPEESPGSQGGKIYWAQHQAHSVDPRLSSGNIFV